jgi:outer membrane immunogenic protein
MKIRLQKVLAASAVTAAVFASAGVAQADGYGPAPRVAYQQPSTWSGLYFGVQSGVEWDSLDASFVFPPPATVKIDHAGGLVGAQLGYQHQFGGIVLGVEGDLAGAYQNKWTSGTCDPLASCAAGVVQNFQLNNVWTLGGRLGFDAGHWMPYVAGGYASSSFTHQARTSAGVLIETWDQRAKGWYIGTGLDWRIARDWIVGIEYRHYDFGDQRIVPFAAPPGGLIPFDTMDRSVSLDTVMVRASWKFNRPDCCQPLK